MIGRTYTFAILTKEQLLLNLFPNITKDFHWSWNDWIWFCEASAL